MRRIVPAALFLLLAAPTFSAEIAGQSARPYVNTAITAISAMPQAWQQQVGQFLTSPNFSAAQLHGALSALNDQSPWKSVSTTRIQAVAGSQAIGSAEKNLTEQNPVVVAQKLSELSLILTPYLGSKREQLLDAARQARTQLSEEKRRSLNTSLQRTAQALGMSIELAGLQLDDSSPLVSAVGPGKKLPAEWQLQRSSKSSRRSLKEQVLALRPGESSILPQETGTHFVFKPNYDVVAKVPGVVTEAQMKQEKSMYSATVEFARRHGGPITQKFLESVPDWYYAKAAELGLFPNIDIRVHDLNAHQLPKGSSLYPAIPGWHADGEFRETYFAQPNLQHVPVSFHIVGTVSTNPDGVSNTQFLERDMEMDIPRADKDYTFWQQVHDQLEALPNKPVSDTKDGDVVLFDARTLHRAMPTKNPGWRMFFRMSMWHKPNLGEGGQLSKQEQLYVVRNKSASKPVGQTKQVRFRPQVKVVNKVSPTATIEDLAKEEGMQGASIEFARQHGGKITRGLLDAVPASFFQKAKELGLRPTVDVLIYRLYPGYTPLIPNHESVPMMRGWHLDESDPAAEANTSKQEIIASVSSHENGVNHTQVLRVPSEAHIPTNPTERAELWDAVDSSLKDVAPKAVRTIQDGELVALTGSTPRRETVTVNRGWRLFFRVSMQPVAAVGDGKFIEFQYVDPSSESKGW